jgi:hypothetical protein
VSHLPCQRHPKNGRLISFSFFTAFFFYKKLAASPITIENRLIGTPIMAMTLAIILVHLMMGESGYLSSSLSTYRAVICHLHYSPYDFFLSERDPLHALSSTKTMTVTVTITLFSGMWD